MINLLVTLLAWSLILGLAIYGLTLDQGYLQFFVLLSALGIGFRFGQIGYLENMRGALYLIAAGWGAYWSGSKTLSTIDFDSPFLTSFYWSTLGYLLLTLFLLFIAIAGLVDATKEPDDISDHRKTHE